MKKSKRMLPPAVVASPEFQALAEGLKQEFLAHVNFIDEIPVRLSQWIEDGASSERLRGLILGIDLDISIQIGIPEQAQMEISAHALRHVWADDRKPLITLLAVEHVSALNMQFPRLGTTLSEVRDWIEGTSKGLSSLLEGFFQSSSFEAALAYLVSIHVLLSGIKFGLGRIGLNPPL